MNTSHIRVMLFLYLSTFCILYVVFLFFEHSKPVQPLWWRRLESIAPNYWRDRSLSIGLLVVFNSLLEWLWEEVLYQHCWLFVVGLGANVEKCVFCVFSIIHSHLSSPLSSSDNNKSVTNYKRRKHCSNSNTSLSMLSVVTKLSSCTSSIKAPFICFHLLLSLTPIERMMNCCCWISYLHLATRISWFAPGRCHLANILGCIRRYTSLRYQCSLRWWCTLSLALALGQLGTIVLRRCYLHLHTPSPPGNRDWHRTFLSRPAESEIQQ